MQCSQNTLWFTKRVFREQSLDNRHTQTHTHTVCIFWSQDSKTSKRKQPRQSVFCEPPRVEPKFITGYLTFYFKGCNAFVPSCFYTSFHRSFFIPATLAKTNLCQQDTAFTNAPHYKALKEFSNITTTHKRTHSLTDPWQVFLTSSLSELTHLKTERERAWSSKTVCII